MLSCELPVASSADVPNPINKFQILASPASSPRKYFLYPPVLDPADTLVVVPYLFAPNQIAPALPVKRKS